PIIAITATAIKEELEKCLIVGMDDYITKAIDSQVLMKKIKTITGRVA
ncbi:MAG: DNA-binding response regulator, partial [Candidatus Scalindua sp.]|nr:DNA-binding response regulator [Candidatus Scalindua sp.]